MNRGENKQRRRRNRAVLRLQQGRFFLAICQGFHYLSKGILYLALALPYFVHYITG